MHGARLVASQKGQSRFTAAACRDMPLSCTQSHKPKVNDPGQKTLRDVRRVPLKGKSLFSGTVIVHDAQRMGCMDPLQKGDAARRAASAWGLPVGESRWPLMPGESCILMG